MVLGSLLLFTWQGRNGEEKIQEQLWMISGLGLKRSNSNKNRAASLRVALSEWLVSQWPAHPLPQGKAQIPMDLLGLGNHSAADSFLCLLTEAILWIVQQSLCPVICSPQLLPLLFIFQKTAVDILDNPTRTWTSALIFFFSLLCWCQGDWAKCHSPGICSFLLPLPDCSAGVRATNPRACLVRLQFFKACCKQKLKPTQPLNGGWVLASSLHSRSWARTWPNNKIWATKEIPVTAAAGAVPRLQHRARFPIKAQFWHFQCQA